MLRSSRVELLGSIDPQLTWHTDSSGENPVPRRPRTYVFVDSKQRLHVKRFCRDRNSMDKELKSKEMSVSESEKLGVTILGHRFDGSLEGVPIKKRLIRSHSPISSRVSPPKFSEASDRVLESQESHSVNKEELHGTSFGTPCGADFSGISILAAAACDSYLEVDNLFSEASVSKEEEDNCLQKGLMCIGSHYKGPSLDVVSGKKHDTSEMSVATLGLSAAEDGSCTRDYCLADEKKSHSDNIHPEIDKDSIMGNSSSKIHKFHWDLNMNVWELAEDQDTNGIPGCVDGDTCNEKVKSELCLDLVGARTELVDISDNNLKGKKYICKDTPAEPRIHHCCDNSENATLPGLCHSLSQIRSDPFNTEELKPSNPVQSSLNTSHGSNIVPKAYPFNGGVNNPCASSDGPCSSSVPAANSPNKIFSLTECIRPAIEQLNVCPPIGNAGNKEVSRDEIRDNNVVSHCSEQMDVDGENGAEERRCKDEGFKSVPIEFPSCRSNSSNKIVLCADKDGVGKMDTVESHLYPVRSVEDTESCHLSRESDRSPKQCDLGLQKAIQGYNDSAVSSSAVNNKGMALNVVSFDAGKNILGGVVKKQDKNDTEDYHAAQPPDMGNVECYRDDDLLYEDGELQESLLHVWGADGDEYGDDEHVDYGSDERENYVYEDANDSSASVVLPNLKTSECRVETLSENYYIQPLEDCPSKNSVEANSEQDSECLDTEGVEEKGSLPEGKHVNRKYGNESLERFIQDCSSMDIDIATYAKNVSKADSFCIKKSDPSMLLKMNLSGTDQLPVASGPAQGLHVKGDLMSDAASMREYCKKDPESKPFRGPLSQTDWRQPSEPPRSVVGTCNIGGRANRNDDSNSIANTRFSRKTEPFHLQESRSKGCPSNEPPGQWVQNERHWFCGSTGYVQPAPKNAIEAAAAKVESNGFAVAPDGTVVDPSHLESPGWSSRRNARSSTQAPYRSHVGWLSSSGRDRLPRGERDGTSAFASQSNQRISREISPGRHLNDDEYRHGSGMFSAVRKKYTFQISGDRIDSALPACRRIPRRDHSPFTLRESSLPRHRGRSPLRKKVRSLHWVSPPRNDGGRIMDNRYKHCAGSPSDFRADDRREPGRLPFRHSGYVDRLSNFVPPFRNQPSQQPSRAIHVRKDLESNLRRREYRVYRRSSERNPPDHLFPRGHQLDVSDYRLDGEEYYRHLNSDSRHPEFIGADKRARLDACDDRRRNGSRYRMFVSPSNKNSLGRMRRIRYSDGVDHRLENSRLKNDPGNEGERTLRSFLGSCEDHLRSSPGRSNGEKGLFRYGREARRNANPKSSGALECDKDTNPLRRIS